MNLKLTTVLFSCLFSLHEAQAQEFWGSIWSTSKDQPSGIYSFTAQADDDQFTPLALDSTLVANEGYCWWNNSFYYINYQSVNGRSIVNYYACNTDNFQTIYTEQVSDNSLLSIASAVDPKSGINYGCFSTADGYGVEWAKMNYRTFDAEERVTIKSLTKNLLAVAIDTAGQAYAVDEDGQFLKINKETGEQTVVGPTGITSKTMQAADFDPSTNRLYWTVEPEGGKSGLYEIDVNTGKASLIKTFPGNQWVLALHVVPSPKAGAPARVKDIDVKPDYDGGGSLSFSMPTTTIEGNALDKALTYYLINNKDTLKKAQAQPGEKVTFTFGWSDFLWGKQTFIVQTENEAGMSAQARWFGNIPTERPTKIDNINMQRNGNENCYDLQGRRVGQNARGIVIRNHKKMWIK